MCVPGGPISPPLSYISPMSSSPWLTQCPCTTLRCHMHVRVMSKSPWMLLKGLMSPHIFPQEGPISPTHVPCGHVPVATSVPPPCPEVPHGCHRCIRAVSVSTCASLAWGFHGEVAQGLVIEGPKRQVWGLRGVPEEEGGAHCGGLGPRGRCQFGRVWGVPLLSHCHCVPPGMHPATP